MPSIAIGNVDLARPVLVGPRCVTPAAQTGKRARADLVRVADRAVDDDAGDPRARRAQSPT